MIWQQQLFDTITAAAPTGASVSVHGSARTPQALDGWSDLDLVLRLTTDIDVADLVPVAVWAVEDVHHEFGQTCRTVLADGRRLDLSISGPGHLAGFHPAPDNEIRFLAAMATAKLGRSDHLIGLHLSLELWQRCLEQAMLLRDRDTGTTVHRHGTDHDQLAAEIHELAGTSINLTARPTIIERTVARYQAWRIAWDAEYVPDWTPLAALTDRGLDAGS